METSGRFSGSPEVIGEGDSRTGFGGVSAIGLAASVGAAVSISLGVYGRLHGATGVGIQTFGFPSVLSMKAWFTTVAGCFALLQLISALWMWGRLPGAGPAPDAASSVHRWMGTVAFVLTLPVAYHCLWSLGFQTLTTRVLAHSLLGCAFYGAFTTKLLLLRAKRLPGITLPVAGGSLVAILSLIWLTSSLWFFQNFGFPGV